MHSGYQTPFSKSLLTALFAGIIATILCIFYDVIYRGVTGFSLSTYVNISTLIFSINLIFVFFGIVHYVFTRFRKGELVFAVFFLLLTIVLVFLAGGIHRSEIPLLNVEFHQLLIPILIIVGLFISVGIPFLYHSKEFEEHVL